MAVWQSLACFGQLTAFLSAGSLRRIVNLTTFLISAIGKFELRRFPTPFAAIICSANYQACHICRWIAVVALHRHCENFIVGRSSMSNAPNYRSLMNRTKSIVLPTHDRRLHWGRREKRKGGFTGKGRGM